ILASAFDVAAKAIAESDPVNSMLARSYNVAVARMIMRQGYDPRTRGLLYFAGGLTCRLPSASSAQLCTSEDNSPSAARTRSAEAIRGIMTAYASSGDPALRDFADLLYSAMWSKPGTGGPDPDGHYVDDEEDGGWFFNALPGSRGSKFFGMY